MNDETLLLRQIHPNFVQQGHVTSQAFRPTPKDEKRLSVYDGDQISPELSFEHYTVTLGCQSAGIMAVNVADCNGIKLPVVPDPNAFLEHAVIDFSAYEKKDIEKRAKILKKKAEERDWLYKNDAS